LQHDINHHITSKKIQNLAIEEEIEPQIFLTLEMCFKSSYNQLLALKVDFIFFVWALGIDPLDE